MKLILKRRILCMVIALLTVLSLASCAAPKNSSSSSVSKDAGEEGMWRDDGGADMGEYDDYAPEAPPNYEPDKDSPTGIPSVGTPLADALRKRIVYVDMSIETLDFDKSVSDVVSLVSEAGGYVDNSYISGAGYSYDGRNVQRRSSYTLRIPAEKMKGFLEGTERLGYVVDCNTRSEDITDYYYDTEAHISALKLQEERLIEILETATELQYILDLEARMSNVRYEIESLTGTLRRYDSLIDYSTVTIELTELLDPSMSTVVTESLGARIKNRFMDSVYAIGNFFEAIIIFFAGNSPVLLLWALIIIAILYAIFKIKKREESRRREQMERYKEIYAAPTAESGDIQESDFSEQEDPDSKE